MSTLPVLPSYSEVAAALKTAAVPFDPAQLHGLLCGLICGTEGNKEISFESIAEKNKSLEDIPLLQSFFEVSSRQITEFSFEFSLLLPEDNTDINQRAEALGLWCQGFLSGLEQSNISLKKRQPSDLTDTLNDLIEIAQVTYGDIIDNEEDESAYFELVEYVRLAVLMIFHELRKGSANQAASESNLLH